MAQDSQAKLRRTDSKPAVSNFNWTEGRIQLIRDVVDE